MADASCAEEDGVEEVVICLCARGCCFAGVEEEGNVDAGGGTLFAEPKEEGKEVGKGSAGVFVSDEVVASD